MNRFIAQTVAGLMLALLGMTMTASAETVKVIKVNIPFQFTFGDRTFPAGVYSVTQPLQNVVSLRNERGETLGSVLADGIDSPSASAVSKLRFTMIAGQHILSEVWREEETTGQRLLGVKEHTGMAARESAESHEADDNQP